MKKMLLLSTVLALALSTSQLVFAADATTAASPAATPAATAAPKPAAPKPVEAPKPAAPKPAEAPKPAAPKPAEAPKPAVAAPAPKPAVVAPAPAAKPAVAAAKPAVAVGDTYTVVEGDTLAIIAYKFGTTYQELAKVNGLKNPHFITVGQKLIVKVTPDVVTTASISSDPATLVKGLSTDGNWIYCIISDVTLNDPLNVDGLFYTGNDPKAKAYPDSPVYRKLALYAQDEAHKVTANYTLTVPRINVTSPNFRIQNGKVVGDIYVNSVGFELSGTEVVGNVYFAKDSYFETAKLAKAGAISGKCEVLPFVDGVTAATIKEGKEVSEIVTGLSKDGSWIYSLTGNVTIPEELKIDGKFNDKALETNKVYRKLALYQQAKDKDAKNQVTVHYTLTAPQGIVVTSPNTNFVNGKVVGNVFVNAEGFVLKGCTIEGNLTFATEAQKASADLSTGFVTVGTVSVK